MTSRRQEKRLVKRLKARDERAFREFVRLHQDRVFNLLFRMLGDRAEAEDLSQEVFVTVFKAIGRFREESKLSTWVYRITANHAKNRLKYLGRRGGDMKQPIEDVSEGELHTAQPSSVPRPDGMAMGYELERRIQRALRVLDEDYRLVILLRDVENLSYEEIAEVAGVALGTVKSRLHRARTALKELLADDEVVRKKGR